MAMKKCMSELELEALLALEESRTAGTGGSPATTTSAILQQFLARAAETKPGLVSNFDIGFEFGDRDALIGSGPHQMWSHEVRPTRHPTISTTMESQSSICVESPNSFNKPMERENRAPGGGGSSGSDSDDESLEMDASHQSGNPMDVKRMRRMVSNRDSARRSRKRKQAHLVDLESQVDTLRGENSSLFKQLTDANHTFSSACTDNRVLKSDVERLRLQVKMAEDMVARGALSCGLDRILQAQIGSPQIMTTLENNSTNNHSANHMNNNNHNNNFRGDENCYVGLSVAEQVHSIAGLDPPSIWEWDSNPSLISKQI